MISFELMQGQNEWTKSSLLALSVSWSESEPFPRAVIVKEITRNFNHGDYKDNGYLPISSRDVYANVLHDDTT